MINNHSLVSVFRYIPKLNVSESSINQENTRRTPEPKLFGFPRPLVGALIGILLFSLTFFSIENWFPKAALLIAGLIAPGLLVMMFLSDLNLSSYGYLIIVFLTSSVPPALIGSLMFSKKNKRRKIGAFLLVIYSIISITLGIVLLAMYDY